MQFRPTVVTNRRNRTRAHVWVPDKRFAEHRPKEGDTRAIITVGQQPRIVAAQPLRMLAEFSEDLSRRAELGHDCAIFALASVTGDSFRKQRFNQAGGLIVKIGALTYGDSSPADQLQEPELAPGEVAFTANADPGDPDFYKVGPHLMVRATENDGFTPLYFSKLGTQGPVVLSSLEQVMDFYPVRTVGVADAFHTAPFPTSTTQA